MLPIEVRWAVLDELLRTDDAETMGLCYKFLTNQYNNSIIVTNHVLAILHDCCDQRTLKKRGGLK